MANNKLKIFLSFIAVSAITVNGFGEKIIKVSLSKGDATKQIQKAINSASKYKGETIRIQLTPGTYNISRTAASTYPYHVSNTTTVYENPDITKHIGLWFRNLENVTFDGNGATLLTHGEMTSFVIDSCKNITFSNFTLASADPSVPEITILSKDESGITFEVTPPSEFVVDNNLFYFKGEGWIFSDGGKLTNLPQYAQVFYPNKNVTLRKDYPLQNYKKVEKKGERTVRMEYDKVPDVNPGEVYQLRHTIRNEVCGFINMSKDITLENISFNFLGNFGIVGQFTENITYDNIRCQPDENSGRTNAGFADFVQMSSCKGKLTIKNSRFEGAHDDPINIHGTHLRAVGSNAPDKITLKYSHGQTFGFTPYFTGDEVEIIDRHTLNPLAASKVKDVNQIDDYTYEITLENNIPALPKGYSIEDLAVENVTWTPEVEIINNYFARTPTRGILITTRGKSLIANNTFFRIPMASILVSDDARNWYESGPVNDLTIRNNTFIECSNPVINILPETVRFNQPVHKNILIEGNKFIGADRNFIDLRGADNVIIRNNIFEPSDSL